MMNDMKKRYNTQLPMIFYLTLFSFIVMTTSSGVLYGLWRLCINLGLLRYDTLRLNVLLLWMLIISAILSTCVFLVSGNQIVFKSIRELSKASKRVAEGDFSQRLTVPKEREIGELIANFNFMVEQLSKKETLSSDFITSMSHEFKTPLATIRGYAQLINDDIPKEKREKYTATITNKVDVLTALVTNILELSKLENTDSKIERVWFSLDEQIRKTILFLEPNWREKQITVIPLLESVRFCGNQALIGEIWQNILENAIKFTPQNGEIVVKMELIQDRIVIRFKDTGIGMDEETRAHCFEKFYQGPAQDRKKGSGLGLAIVKRIIEIYNGKIDVDSIQGQGTTVCIILVNPRHLGREHFQ